MPTAQISGTIEKLKNRFTSPKWLSKSPLSRNHRLLWLLLLILLTLYFFDWGLSTERAVQCLHSGQPPQGRWVETITRWPGMPVLTILISLAVLCITTEKSVFSVPKSKTEWNETSIVGLAWAVPLLATRYISIFLPESPCKAADATPLPLWNIGQLAGPAEEVWFAATIAIWILLTQDKIRLSILGIFFGCMILRGIFHVYQGWESVGLFIWGLAAGVAIAITGRWVILFILHFLNNSLITAGGSDSTTTAFYIFLSCFILYLLTANKPNHEKSKNPDL